MNEEEYNNFIKRYDKFKKNNLPTPFWDEERQTLEYVYFSKENKAEIYCNLTDALERIAYTGFYYSFTTKYITSYKDENGKIIRKIVVGHDHAHTFEEVVKHLYAAPESFKIAKEEEELYSTQELEYLRRVQKYLLFIGVKDLEKVKAPVGRYRSKLHSKYENAFIYSYKDEILKLFKSGKRDFRVIDWYPEYRGPCKYKPKEYQALITDMEDNFKMFVEFTYEEVKYFKDIKKVCKKDLQDDDKVILVHFKVLETF